MDSLSEPTNNNIYNGADIFLIISIIVCLLYFWNYESGSFGLLFTFMWLSFSWICYNIYRCLLFLWVLAAGFLLGFMFFFCFRPEILSDVIGRFGDLGLPFNFDPDIISFNPDQMLIYLLIMLILYFFIVWIIGKTGYLQASGACVLVGALSPIMLPAKLLFLIIAVIALCGVVILLVLILSSIPILIIGYGVHKYTNWNIIIIILLIFVLIILFIIFAKFFMTYAVCAAVGFIVLSYTQEVFSTASFIQAALSMIQQITANRESLSQLLSVLLKIIYDISILTLDRYSLFNLFIKPFTDKFIILLSSVFLSIALSIGRFRFFGLNKKS